MTCNGLSRTLIERATDLSYMAREATETIPLKPETKELIRERKPDGWTYDYWLQRQLGIVEQ